MRDPSWLSAREEARQSALVTGSSSGIGRSIAGALWGNAGYTVYAGMRGVEGCDKATPQSLQAEGADRALPVGMDVLSEESCVAAVEEITGIQGRLDMVVQIAGMLACPCPFVPVMTRFVQRV